MGSIAIEKTTSRFRGVNSDRGAIRAMWPKSSHQRCVIAIMLGINLWLYKTQAKQKMNNMPFHDLYAMLSTPSKYMPFMQTPYPKMTEEACMIYTRTLVSFIRDVAGQYHLAAKNKQPLPITPQDRVIWTQAKEISSRLQRNCGQIYCDEIVKSLISPAVSIHHTLTNEFSHQQAVVAGMLHENASRYPAKKEDQWLRLSGIYHSCFDHDGHSLYKPRRVEE